MPLSAITGLAAAKTNLPLVQEFLLFAVIAAFFLIAAFLIHKKLCADYSPIRDKKFHVLFGTLFSVFFGEFVSSRLCARRVLDWNVFRVRSVQLGLCLRVLAL